MFYITLLLSSSIVYNEINGDTYADNKCRRVFRDHQERPVDAACVHHRRVLTKLDASNACGGISLRNAHARCTPRRLTHMRGLYLNWFPPWRPLVPSFGYNFIKRVIGFEFAFRFVSESISERCVKDTVSTSLEFNYEEIFLTS